MSSEASDGLRAMARRVGEQRRQALDWYIRSQVAEQMLRYAPDEVLALYRSQVREAQSRFVTVPPVPDDWSDLVAEAKREGVAW